MEKIKAEFSKVYDTYNGKIYRFIYLKVDSREVAEDLASEVFLSAWETYQRQIRNPKSEIRNIQAYLYQIAKNTIADHYGSKRIRTVSVEAHTDIPDLEDSAQDQAMVSMEIERIKGVLQTLKDDYQDLVIWKYLDELSYPEIAQITGKTEDTVRVNVHRAMQALKGKLEATVTK